MGIDITKTRDFKNIQQKALEEYFSYDAKIKINNKINKIIDEVFDNGNKRTKEN